MLYAQSFHSDLLKGLPGCTSGNQQVKIPSYFQLLSRHQCNDVVKWQHTVLNILNLVFSHWYWKLQLIITLCLNNDGVNVFRSGHKRDTLKVEFRFLECWNARLRTVPSLWSKTLLCSMKCLCCRTKSWKQDGIRQEIFLYPLSPSD